MAVFDTTKGGVNSTSYATVEEASDYLDGVFGAEEWASIAEDSQERLLLTATKMIEGLTCAYPKASDTQALSFPCAAIGYLDAYGKRLDDGFTRAKEACILQAFYIYQQNDNLAEARGNKIAGVNSESIGPTSKGMLGFNPYMKWGGGVLKLLAPYVDLEIRCRRG